MAFCCSPAAWRRLPEQRTAKTEECGVGEERERACRWCSSGTVSYKACYLESMQKQNVSPQLSTFSHNKRNVSKLFFTKSLIQFRLTHLSANHICEKGSSKFLVFSKDDLQAGQALSPKYEEKSWKEGVSAPVMFKLTGSCFHSTHTFKRAVMDYWVRCDPWVYGEAVLIQHG